MEETQPLIRVTVSGPEVSIMDSTHKAAIQGNPATDFILMVSVFFRRSNRRVLIAASSVH